MRVVIHPHADVEDSYDKERETCEYPVASVSLSMGLHESQCPMNSDSRSVHSLQSWS